MLRSVYRCCNTMKNGLTRSLEIKMHTKSEILVIAGKLFSTQGYYGTSMRELARALNMKGASLYSHINSKEEILWEIVNGTADQFLAQAETISPAIPLEEQLAQLVRGHLRVIAHALPYAIVFFHEGKFLSPALHARIKAKRDTYEANFRRIIEQGTRQGIFQVANPHLATQFVLSALNWTCQWFYLEESFSIEQLANQYLIFILRVLKNGQ